jgi:hypothetical protein
MRVSSIPCRVIFCLCLLSLAAPEPACSADCLDYEQFIHWLSTWSTPGTAADVEAAGGYAYIAGGPSGLSILDIGDPENPTIAGSLPALGNMKEIVLDGSYAYIAESDAGLSIVDVSDPSNPVRVGLLDLVGPVDGVDVSGDLACIAASHIGVYVVSIQDPANPFLLGTANTPGFAQGVTIVGNRALVADGYQGMQIVSLSNPALPFVLGGVDTPGILESIAVSGTYACAADRDAGFHVIDVSDMTSPEIIATLDVGTAHDVWLEGSRAYLAAGSGGLLVIDIEVPSSPFEIMQWWSTGAALSLFLTDGIALLACGSDGLTLADVSPLAEAPPLASLPVPGHSWEIERSGGYAYVTASEGGMHVIDIQDPADPVIVGTFLGCQIGAYEVAVSGDVAYVGEGINRYLHAVDVSNPSSPTELSSLLLPDDCLGLGADERYAYVATRTLGLLVVDATIPAVISTTPLGAMARAVRVRDGYAYVACTTGGLKVVDVHDPNAPVVVGSFAGAYLANLTLSGPYAYLACSGDGVTILDVGDPASPSFVGSIDTPGDVEWIAVHEPYVYVSVSHSVGVEIIDVHDRTSPEMVSLIQIPGPPEGIVAGEQGFFLVDRFSLISYPFQCEPPVAAPEALAGTSVDLDPAGTNPFRRSTAFRLNLVRDGSVTANVHDVAGRRVRELARGRFAAGPLSLTWDGKDGTGMEVPSGVYFCVCKVGGETRARSVQLIR